MAVIRYSNPSRPPGLDEEPNGCAHKWVAPISNQTVVSANTPFTNHAAGRHRREGRYPVGKSNNKSASMATGISHVQLDSQPNARPAGKDPGLPTSAYAAYWFEKPPTPSASPATRNSQPRRFSGRRDASTKPITAPATFTTCKEMLETVQPVRLAGTRCRSRYASPSPPPISATDPAATQPDTHRAVRALIRIPHAPITTTGPGAGCTSPTNHTLRRHRSGNVTAHTGRCIITGGLRSGDGPLSVRRHPSTVNGASRFLRKWPSATIDRGA